jgi:hypothetical protein
MRSLKTTKDLAPEEWDFSKLEPTELETCRDYELAREVVRCEKEGLLQKAPIARGIDTSDFKARELPEWMRHSQPGPKAKPLTKPLSASSLETRVKMIREAWDLADFKSSVNENPTWFQFPASRVLVLYFEWPDKPYREIELPVRMDRIKRLFSLSGSDENLAYLLDPSNAFTGRKWTKIGIPLSLNKGDLRKIFAAWLRVHWHNIHSGRQKDQPLRGRGSEKASVSDDLNALAAFRLCKRAKLSRREVIRLIKTPKIGKSPQSAVYSTEKTLDKPLKRIQRRLADFLEQVLDDLQPIEPMNLPPPDFTHL